MLTEELQQTINRAFEEAAERRHEYLTLEHLLYALLHERTASNVVRRPAIVAMSTTARPMGLSDTTTT